MSNANRCGCIETYPQLVPGKVSHGPGCALSAARRTITDAMVDRFLAWKLPEDFHPDAGISFSPYFNVEYNAKHGKPPQRHEPIGTNLFTAVQAKEMLAHVTAPLQAQIDRLMLEYCPEEMTEAQTAEWAKHQVPAGPEASEQIDAAVGRTLSSAAAPDMDAARRAWHRRCGLDGSPCPTERECMAFDEGFRAALASVAEPLYRIKAGWTDKIVGLFLEALNASDSRSDR